MKKFTLACMAMWCIATYTYSQVSIGVTPYTTLKAAFDAINAGTHTGAVAIDISGNTTETASAVLNASGSGSASYTSVVIKPTASNISVSGNIAGALVNLNGADNVTIDGRVGTTDVSQLTFSNTNTATLSAVIRMASTGSRH